ncbi:MAG: hypothetical protein ACRDJN_27870, partial [Chloroflexota bacterium]
LVERRRDALIADYVAAEDALRAFTDRNFGRMCAICARWTLLAARTNAEGHGTDLPPDPLPKGKEGPGQPAVSWRLSSWVTNCCNANHALESMSEESLAGIVASREEGQEWWRKVKRANAAPCAALTDQGCHLQRGRPELCNKYFCEAVRDYLWMLGGEEAGARLAGSLDELQRRWARLYAAYQGAIAELTRSLSSGVEGRASRAEGRGFRFPTLRRRGQAASFNVRRESEWEGFFAFLEAFDQEIARHARPVTPEEVTQRLFKVEGERALYEPFFEQELASIGGAIRAATPGEVRPPETVMSDGP